MIYATEGWSTLLSETILNRNKLWRIEVNRLPPPPTPPPRSITEHCKTKKKVLVDLINAECYSVFENWLHYNTSDVFV